MDYQLTAADFAEHLNGTQPQDRPSQPLGSIRLRPYAMPGVQALRLHWQIPGNRILLSDTQPAAEAISISFQLGGGLFTRFGGIHHPLNMKPGTHNMVYVTEKNDEHVFGAAQEVSVFQLTIEKRYFMQCVEPGTRWSDQVLEKLEKKVSFAAAEQSPAITPRMHGLLGRIEKNNEAGPVKGLLFGSRVLELMALQIEQFSTQTEAASFSTGDRQKLHALKLYLDAHFLEELSLAQLSRVCCLNEFKVKKGFKAEFGETVFGYVRKLRMGHAEMLLRNTSCSVDEVAAELGYEHAQHFTKAFKAFTGFVPTACRRRR